MRATESFSRYSRYFRINAPSAGVLASVLILLGLLVGSLSIALAYYPVLYLFDYRLLVIGASIGFFSISLPALLTVLLVKAENRRLMLKHATLSTLLITIFYAFFFIVVAGVYGFTKNVAIAYVILLLANAGIYGYWFVMGSVVVNVSKRSAAITSAIHPLLNVLFFLPFSIYLLGVKFPINVTLAKLFIGMLVFLAASYSFLYFVDLPSKRVLGSSGLKAFSAMISYWLYNFSSDVKLIGEEFSEKRPLRLDILAVSNSKGLAAVFAGTDLHFGPFVNAGGSIAPAYIGERIARLGASPFVLHTTVDLRDNPVSAKEVYAVARHVDEAVRSMSNKEYKRAYGSVSFGESGACRAIDIKLGDARMFVLSKAPKVTEDIEKDVGEELRSFAERKTGSSKIILIDAHNTRFESAPKTELEGVKKGSPYVEAYKHAIARAIASERDKPLKIGFAHRKLSAIIGKRKDLGSGYASVMVIDSGEKFCLIYFDANNMLPGFRKEVIEHVAEKFGMQCELCTTDTHEVNLISEDARNALGRYTKPSELFPVLDLMIGYAIGNLDAVSIAYRHIETEPVRVWGNNANELLNKTSQSIRRVVKELLPVLVIAAFIIAAWLLSFV